MMPSYGTVAGLLFLTAGRALAQAETRPSFDVASVKRMVGSSGGIIRQEITPTSLSMHGVPLGYCLRWAYGLQPYAEYRTAGPDWVDPPHAEFYDIVAKTGAPATVEQLRRMLQTLLAERFQLVLHREQRELAVIALSVGKNGPKLKPSEKAESDGQIKRRSLNLLDCQGFSMPRLAEFLDGMTRIPRDSHPIVDETGLAGTFDFTLDFEKHWDYDAAGKSVLDAQGHYDMMGTVTKTLRDLGLKLEAERAPVEVLVIDHVEKTPIEN
jgi:uncharacterized protein (TIGR03435 family)